MGKFLVGLTNNSSNQASYKREELLLLKTYFHPFSTIFNVKIYTAVSAKNILSS